MRRRLTRSTVAVLALLVGAAGWSQPAAAQAVPADFTFRGAGFGHGVGMSQYGAKRQAEAGRAGTEIISTYYAGARVATVEDLVPLRVNLVNKAPSAEVRGESLVGGGALKVTAGATVVGTTANQSLSLRVEGADVVVVRSGEPVARGASAIVEWDNRSTLLNVAGPGETLAGRGHRYRHGAVDVSVVDGGLNVVLQLGLHELYLRGIAEVPASWPAAALQAQAITARTYALRKFRAGPRTECGCHVYDTTADQVYAGWEKESAAGSSAWITAVAATSPSPSSGQVVMVGDRLASTNYSSSSAGFTESNIDGFASPTLMPELRPVPDPWSATTDNPFSAWSHTRSQAAVAGAFQLPDVVGIDLSRRTAGGAVKHATATSSSGATATIRGTELRFRLALPSAAIGPPTRRASGADRFSTAVAVGKLATPSSRAVVIVSGAAGRLVDGLVSAPLARSLGAPLLLANPDGLPPAVAAEVRRRGTTTAYLVGGGAALGSGVESGLRAAGVTAVRRIAGPDRFATAAAVARELHARSSPRTHVVVASGEGGRLADALAVGGPAATSARPILLTTRDLVPAPTREAIDAIGVRHTLVVGGAAAVSDAVVASLPQPSRVAGPDRFATAAAVAEHFAPSLGVGQVAVAAGVAPGLVDALAAGSLGAPTLLVMPGALPPATAGFLNRHPTTGNVTVIGGPAAVSDDVLIATRARIWPSGRFASRMEGFHEVSFAVQPPSGPADAPPVFRGCAAWADTPERRAQGMKGRTDFSGYDAMAFTTASPSSDSFTMEGVAIPLEVSWFAPGGPWIGRAEMAPCPAGAMCPLYPPPGPWTVALETPSGGSDRLGAVAGSQVLVGGSC
ncbi:MAG: SpoIID/LytB domain-containing protein [Actinobacteria bacterium]|nr:SpoIID/LytB domain-containing protein [Actinomycetota bacterium]